MTTPNYPPPGNEPGFPPPTTPPMAPAPPAGQQFPGPSATPKSRNWKKIVLILALVVGLPLAGIGACSYWLYGLVTGPMDAANAYMEAVSDGDLEAARGLTDPACVTDLEGFLSQTETDPLIGYTLIIRDFESVNGVGTGSVQGTLEFRDEGSVETRVHLNQDGDGWQVCQVRLNVGPDDN